MKPIDYVADTVLRLVNEYIDPNAVIAGGYVRDTILRRKPKDIDICLHVDTLDDLRSGVEYVIGATDLAVTRTVFCKEYNTNPTMDWCKEIVKMTVGNVYVDLICMLEPIDEEATVVFNNFDFGICRVARRNGKNILSQDFKNDRDNKTLTFLDTSRDHEDMRRVTQDHLQRLKDKFPTYTVKGLEDYE